MDFFEGLTVSKEWFVSYRGIRLMREMIRFIPETTPSCKLIVPTIIGMDFITAYDYFCDNIRSRLKPECLARENKQLQWLTWTKTSAIVLTSSLAVLSAIVLF